MLCTGYEDCGIVASVVVSMLICFTVTGACFIVFNGALKPTSGLRAKSSIVEDGLMVQITSDAMTELKQVLSEMRDYKILCGSVEIAQPDEMVIIEWNNDEKHINAGSVLGRLLLSNACL